MPYIALQARMYVITFARQNVCKELDLIQRNRFDTIFQQDTLRLSSNMLGIAER